MKERYNGLNKKTKVGIWFGAVLAVIYVIGLIVPETPLTEANISATATAVTRTDEEAVAVTARADEEAVAATARADEESATATASAIPPEFDDIRDTAVTVTYDDLFRNNEVHVGKIVYYRGEVVQVMDAGDDQFQLRVNLTEDSFFWTDPVFVQYSGPRVLDDDIVEFVAEVVGLLTYSATLGNEITIPHLEALDLRLAEDAPALSGGATSSPDDTSHPSPTPSEYEQTISGSGDYVETLDLRSGLALFEIRYTGDSNFVIWLRGLSDDLLVNHVGNYSGTVAVGVDQGEYLLDIQASGEWTIRIREPRNQTPTTLRSFTGTGDNVTDFIRLGEGMEIISESHLGESNFVVWLLDEDGDNLKLLANDIGNYEGSTSVRIDSPGSYIITVEADGDWTVTVGRPSGK